MRYGLENAEIESIAISDPLAKANLVNFHNAQTIFNISYSTNPKQALSQCHPTTVAGGGQ